MKLTIDIWSQTDTGKIRDHNEDNFCVSENLANQEWGAKGKSPMLLGKLGSLLAVADGMGGTNAGEVASEIAVQEVQSSFAQIQELPTDPHIFLKAVIMRAHQAILEHAKLHPQTRGMGTTLILAWVVDGLLYVAWSGDSRCYLFREGIEFRPLTDDHSLVWEMVKNKILTAEEARTHPDSNIITQSLGNNREAPKPEALKQGIPLQAGDRLLLCSDGLNAMVPDPQIGTLLIQGESAQRTCQSLIEAANLAGGYDNITTLLLDVMAIEQTPPPPPPTVSSQESSPPTHLKPSSSITPPPFDGDREINSNKNSWLWIMGGILLFGGLTAAVIFWLGRNERDDLLPSNGPLQATNSSLETDSTKEGIPSDSTLILIAETDNPAIEEMTQTRGINPPSGTEPSGSPIQVSDQEGKSSSAPPPTPPSASDRNPPNPQVVQQKVRQILDLKYGLIRHDRLEILQYKRLNQNQKDNLRYIRSRILNQQPKSIYHDLTRLVRLGGEGKSEIVEIREKDGDELMQQLDALIEELERFERLIQQMEQ
ncbi:MAG: PP2C family serine/threonine-protein phosphatase [Bacteroidota bacterium]